MLYRTDVETNQADLISCQTCGRPNYDLWGVVREIKEYTLAYKHKQRNFGKLYKNK